MVALGCVGCSGFRVDGGAVSWQQWLGNVGHGAYLWWLEDEESYGGSLNVEGLCCVFVPHGAVVWGHGATVLCNMALRGGLEGAAP